MPWLLTSRGRSSSARTPAGCVIKTGRAGLAARAGHDLTIEVTRWSARVRVPADGGVAAAEITAELDLGSLAVREGTGGAKPLTDRDRGDILNQARKILGGGTATFASTRVIPGPFSGGAVEGTVTFNGRSQPVRLQVTGLGPRTAAAPRSSRPTSASRRTRGSSAR